MRVSQTLETPDGTVTFVGELSQQELDLIISVGLNFLMGQGAVPFQVQKELDFAKNLPGNETEQ